MQKINCVILFIALPGQLRKKRVKFIFSNLLTINHIIGHDNASYNEDKTHHQEHNVSG